MVVPDERVTSLMLDVTDAAQIRGAVDRVESLDILINNAGVSVPNDLSDRFAFERHLAVNLYGTLDVTQAFLPSLTRCGGAVVNIVSLGAVAAVPVLPAYSVSKAATLSVTQSLRALLAGRGVSVYAVMPGPIDTDMVRGLDIPKTAPDDVARAMFEALQGQRSAMTPSSMRKSSVVKSAGLGDGAVERAMCADENDWLRSPNETNTAEIAASSPGPL
jgi:NAD(P)-dependent dehydrogenase (short-subunit alcohol dehydrogenase family)